MELFQGQEIEAPKRQPAHPCCLFTRARVRSKRPCRKRWLEHSTRKKWLCLRDRFTMEESLGVHQRARRDYCFSSHKWAKELDYSSSRRCMPELIAVRFAYEWHDDGIGRMAMRTGSSPTMVSWRQGMHQSTTSHFGRRSVPLGLRPRPEAILIGVTSASSLPSEFGLCLYCNRHQWRASRLKPERTKIRFASRSGRTALRSSEGCPAPELPVGDGFVFTYSGAMGRRTRCSRSGPASYQINAGNREKSKGQS